MNTLTAFILEKLESQESADNALTTIVRALFTQVNFAPVIRYQIGWRGFKDISKHTFTWTMKIKNLEGVFGIYLSKANYKKDWLTGEFLVTYFPDAQFEQDLLDKYSPQAQAIAYKSNYIKQIRSSQIDSDFLSYFILGTMNMSFNKDKITLNIQADKTYQVFAQDDVIIQQQILYKKGELLAQIPCLSLLNQLFDVMIKTFNFNIKQPPSVLYQGKNIQDANKILELVAYNTDLNQSEPQDFQNYHIVQKTIEPQLLETFQTHLKYNQSGVILDSKSLPKLIILTGYLGSGKTSFLKNFVQYQNQRNNFTAIVQNEVGAVNIDTQLTGQEFLVSELEEGCVCCSIIGQFNYAIKKILAQFTPDTIIIELSGMANPQNLISEIEELKELVEFDNLTCVIDACYFMQNKNKLNDLIIEQIKISNLVIVNKQDLVNVRQLNQIIKKIKIINPYAVVIPTTHSNINPSMLYDMDSIDMAKLKENANSSPHTLNYECRKIELPPVISRNEVIKIIEKNKNIFRSKGFFSELDEKGNKRRVLLQYVNHQFSFEEFEQPTQIEENLLVCIFA